MCLLESQYKPSHQFSSNLLDTSCLCKWFVVFYMSVFLLLSRGVWRPHKFTYPGSNARSAISVMLGRNWNWGAKVRLKPSIDVIPGFTCIPDHLQEEKKGGLTWQKTLCVPSRFVHVPLIPPHKHSSWVTALTHVGNNTNTASPCAVWDVVNIFWALTAPQGWCESCPWHERITLGK